MLDTKALRRTAHRLFFPTRQNHALEHATVTLLLKRSDTPLRLAGRATGNGFYLLGDLSTEEIEMAAREALDRMKGGDEHLAVSPFCGTNLLVAGALATLAAMVTLGTRDRFRKLPTAMVVSALAVAAAQPLGAMVQRRFTTTGDVSDLRIIRVTRIGGTGMRTVHKVETARFG
jgi:hypothetical protein